MTEKELRLTQPSLKVLKLFIEEPHRARTGAEIIKAISVSSGTIYPVLVRFENHGLLESNWEAGRAQDLGRPRRRFYKITAHGRAVAREALGELR